MEAPGGEMDVAGLFIADVLLTFAGRSVATISSVMSNAI